MVTGCATTATYKCIFSCKHEKLMKSEVANVSAFMSSWSDMIKVMAASAGMNAKVEQLGTVFVDGTKFAIVKLKLTLSAVVNGKEKSSYAMSYLILVNRPGVGWDLYNVVAAD